MIETCAFEGCKEPVLDYETVPDYSGNLAGLCLKHYALDTFYYNYLTRKFTATKGNGTENMYAPPRPLLEDD